MKTLIGKLKEIGRPYFDKVPKFSFLITEENHESLMRDIANLIKKDFIPKKSKLMRYTADEILQAANEANIPREDMNRLISYLIEKK